MGERQGGWPQRPCGRLPQNLLGTPGWQGWTETGLGSCSMEALVTECLQPRDGREEPDPADSGVPDVPRPLLGAAQNSRSALLKGCSSITVGLRTLVRREATSRRHAGPQLSWHFLYQWSQPGAILSPESGMVGRRVFWSSRLEREVCYRHVVLAGQKRCSKVHAAHSLPTPQGYACFLRQQRRGGETLLCSHGNESLFYSRPRDSLSHSSITWDYF